jgi:hypothetical protein
MDSHPTAPLLDLDALDRAASSPTPFPNLVAQNLLHPPALAAVRADFPPITQPGVLPVADLPFGPCIAQLITEIRSPALESRLKQKFGVTLAGKPLMVTVRSQAQKRDGRIHTDSKDKFLTCLLYLNDREWQAEGGRLRLLHGPDNLEDMIAEVPPRGGGFLAFLRTDRSWHGHKIFEGERRSVMFNWLVSEHALTKNLARHKFSAAIKRRIGRHAG